MISLNENIYDMTLISKVKEHTGSRKLKTIINTLKHLAEEDVKKYSGLKIKKFAEKKEEEKKPELKILPIIGFQNYFEDYKKHNSRSIVNNDADYVGENTPSTVDDNEKDIKKVSSFDFSEDE